MEMDYPERAADALKCMVKHLTKLHLSEVELEDKELGTSPFHDQTHNAWHEKNKSAKLLVNKDRR